MAIAGADSDLHSQLALAATYEGDDPVLLERIVPLVDTIEISPDAIARSEAKRARLRPEVLDEYAAVLPQVNLIAHGVGLSIGSFDRWDDTYLRLLDELFSRFKLEWHSEHLACSMVAGENVGTMLPLPRNEEALQLVCTRVDDIQQRYQVPFLLEHVISLLPEMPGQFTPAGFLNAITARTGCGLVLDAYNLECDAYNQRLDIDTFLDELDLAPVRELHIAGGVRHNGFQLDIHSRAVCDSTLALAIDIIKRAPNLRVVTYEFLKEAIAFLGHDTICAELSRIRRAIRR
ncbi:MAG: DUF692 family multinuclear iron-containing protein [Candidatus Tumulicola sp.]